MAYALVIVLLAALAVMGYIKDTVAPSPLAAQQTTQAEWTQMYGQAAGAFLTANPGYSGQISDQQMVTELGSSWSTLPAAMTRSGMQHGAFVSGGVPYAWALLPTAQTGSAVGKLIKQDAVAAGNLSITVDENGTLVNPQMNNPQPAPAGVPNGAMVVSAK
ncbi:MAG: hypothetical protein HKL99_10645 [Burkholderiales bacterium]|nr:hypothetical protein [Burkholderiales bacterium]